MHDSEEERCGRSLEHADGTRGSDALSLCAQCALHPPLLWICVALFSRFDRGRCSASIDRCASSDRCCFFAAGLCAVLCLLAPFVHPPRRSSLPAPRLTRLSSAFPPSRSVSAAWATAGTGRQEGRRTASPPSDDDDGSSSDRSHACPSMHRCNSRCLFASVPVGRSGAEAWRPAKQPGPVLALSIE